MTSILRKHQVFLSVTQFTTTSRAIQSLSLHKKALFSTLREASVKRKAHSMEALWKPPVPALVGASLKEIDTPSLIVDLDVMASNMEQLKESMKKYPEIAVRPHAKAHKCPQIAKMQVEHGCVGVCTQTLTESEAMVYGGGPTDVFMSNQCIGNAKIHRLVALAKAGATISVCVDDPDNIREISAVAKEVGVNIALVVEVNVGQNRCGVPPGSAAVVLAHLINDLPNVNFKGIQCYMGLNQHVRTHKDRQAATDKVVELTKDTLQALKDAGIECPYVTGGGTGTYPYEAASGVFTELQPGSYIFMDVDYWNNKGSGGEEHFEYFKHSLFVLTTVQSVTGNVRAVGDAGLKAVSFDSGPPMIQGHPQVEYGNGGDEHGIITPADGFKVGDHLKLIPGHCDPTVNMYEWLIAVHGDTVESVWPVLGRGPGV